MPTITNISPQGALDLPLLGRVIEAGETVEVDQDQADLLEGQPAVWLIAADVPTIADLREIAANRGIDIKGLRKRADIEAAISAAESKGDDQ